MPLAELTRFVAGAAERLVEVGFTLDREPADRDWGRSAYLRDPAGNLVELTAA